MFREIGGIPTNAVVVKCSRYRRFIWSHKICFFHNKEKTAKNNVALNYILIDINLEVTSNRRRGYLLLSRETKKRHIQVAVSTMKYSI
jgi:hypothetical protein